MEILAAKRRTNIFGNQRICLFFHSDTENGLGASTFAGNTSLLTAMKKCQISLRTNV